MEESVKHYIFESFRLRYVSANRKGKSEILDEICAKFNCHRKHAVRLMKPKFGGKRLKGSKRGPKPKYKDPEFLRALHRVRKVMEFRASPIIKSNMPEWLPSIENHYGAFSAEVREKLLKVSTATMDRYFKWMREQGGKGLTTTRPGKILRNEIAIQTASQWDGTIPGIMSTDTVAHCGNTTQGQFAYSLDMVCPVLHWVELRAVWGKGESGVLEQTKDIEKALPFALKGVHVDNGTEFMNWHYYRYFSEGEARKNFKLTRSRPNKKDDNCYVEQKNWSVVRRYFGYDRFDFPELVPLINDLYKNELSLYLNHFCPTFKVEQKILIKSRYKRIYGKPVTPYQRAIESEHVKEDVKIMLKKLHAESDPVALKLTIERKLKNIFNLLKRLNTTRNSTSAA